MTFPGRWIREGVVTGLIAYVAVAVFYFAFDVLTARGALFTVNRIGQLMLYGSAGIATIEPALGINLSAVIGYSAVHLVASLLIGILVCRLVHEAELQPMLAQVALLFIVAGFAATIAGVGLLSASIRGVLPWWSIMMANALAVLVAGLVLLRRHPEFLVRLQKVGHDRRRLCRAMSAKRRVEPVEREENVTGRLDLCRQSEGRLEVLSRGTRSERMVHRRLGVEHPALTTAVLHLRERSEERVTHRTISRERGTHEALPRLSVGVRDPRFLLVEDRRRTRHLTDRQSLGDRDEL